jgi:hypothetical protein
MELYDEFKKAFEKAIEDMGMERFKSTSIFLRARRIMYENKKEAA